MERKTIETTFKDAAVDTKKKTIGKLFDFACIQCHYIEFVNTIHKFLDFFSIVDSIVLHDFFKGFYKL